MNAIGLALCALTKTYTVPELGSHHQNDIIFLKYVGVVTFFSV
jgi:hypothetical protein